MKAESRQIPQKLAARLKFVCCLRSVERIPATTVFRKCWHLLKELWDRKRENWRTVPPSKNMCLEQGITKNWLHCTLPMYVERLGLSWFFVNCYALFNRVASLWHASSRTCVISRGSVILWPLPNADFLSSDQFMRLWEGQPFSFERYLVMSL